MGRTGEFAEAAGGRRPAINRASGWGNAGRERSGKNGFGYLVRGASVQLGDHIMRDDGTVGQVSHLSSDALRDRWATYSDGQRQHLAALAHYSVGDSPDHFTKKRRQ